MGTTSFTNIRSNQPPSIPKIRPILLSSFSRRQSVPAFQTSNLGGQYLFISLRFRFRTTTESILSALSRPATNPTSTTRTTTFRLSFLALVKGREKRRGYVPLTTSTRCVRVSEHTPIPVFVLSLCVHIHMCRGDEANSFHARANIIKRVVKRLAS